MISVQYQECLPAREQEFALLLGFSNGRIRGNIGVVPSPHPEAPAEAGGQPSAVPGETSTLRESRKSEEKNTFCKLVFHISTRKSTTCKG